jgi:hypothetical protein
MNKKQVSQLIFSFFILTFSACTDHQYDLDDEKVDKNVVFSPDGINIPIGQIDKMSIDKELKKTYDNMNSQIQVDENGILYIEYTGEFPIVFPDFQLLTISPMVTNPVDLQGISSGTVTIPKSKFPLFNFMSVPFEIDQPVFTGEQQGLQINTEKINFSNLGLDLNFDFSGIQFGAGDADLILTLEYPANFILKDQVNPVQKIIHITPNKTSYEIKDIINIVAYDYRETDNNLKYKLELDVKSGLAVTTSGGVPQFKMTLSASNNLQVESLECKVEGTETKSDIIHIENFTDAYHGYVFNFDNPLLEFSLETNLACNFSAGLNLSSDIGSASLQGNNRLQFPKPTQPYPQTQKSSYILSPKNPGNNSNWKPFNIHELFNYVPSYLGYEVSVHFNDHAVLRPDNAKLNAQYKLTLPFVFRSFDVNISDTVPDLFSEDLYERLFEYAKGDIQVIADSVAIYTDKDIIVKAEAHILDEKYQPVGISAILDDLLSSERNDNKIVIQISNANKEKMKKARHLAFVFNLHGQGVVSNRDYIHIRKIRILSDDGIYFTF